ncbi:hypothetical protein Q31b_52030 [Novipirellula aureliae]|uniref:Hemin uptake protein hemP n=1 Tax=Novipirellula aureliae TaxID=2527966 RepID=A0A5C6DGB6_9BACT|nr:hemin uptake protein HemP [Novipirellula aureliae]TWU35768.1 hypothetical protein Q31b_52030 [Novipirellula aureliae]
MQKRESSSDGDSRRTTESNDSAIRQIESKIVHFNELARCGEEVWIEHEGQLYRLRLTRQGKLILTK